jgi:hypothetical protein
MVANLGFRSQSLAPPQALRHRRAPRAKTNPTDDELAFSLSRCYDKLKLIGHQTEPLPSAAATVRLWMNLA